VQETENKTYELPGGNSKSNTTLTHTNISHINPAKYALTGYNDMNGILESYAIMVINTGVEYYFDRSEYNAVRIHRENEPTSAVAFTTYRNYVQPNIFARPSISNSGLG